MNFKKWVKSIQTAGYNGARTVFYLIKKSSEKLCQNTPLHSVQCFKIFGKACTRQPTKQSLAKLATTLPTLAYIAKYYYLVVGMAQRVPRSSVPEVSDLFSHLGSLRSLPNFLRKIGKSALF
jgi:hypothetical protein